MTLHKYLYAGTDPLNKTDPSGFMTSIELNAAALATMTIASMAVTRAQPILFWLYMNYFSIQRWVDRGQFGLQVSGLSSGVGPEARERSHGYIRLEVAPVVSWLGM